MAKNDKSTKIIMIGITMGILLIAAGFFLSSFDTTVTVDNTPPNILWIGPGSGLQTNTFDVLFNVEDLCFSDFVNDEVSAYNRFVIFTIDDVNVTSSQVELDIFPLWGQGTEGDGVHVLKVRLWDYAVETGYHDIRVQVTDLAENTAEHEVSLQTWGGTVKGDVVLLDSSRTIIEEGSYVGGTIYVQFIPTEGADQIDAVKMRIFTEEEMAFADSNSGDASGIDYLLQNDIVGMTYLMPMVSTGGYYEQALDTKATMADGTYFIWILVEDKTGGFSSYSVLEFTAANGNPGVSMPRANNYLLVIVGVVILVICIMVFAWKKRADARKFTSGGYYG